MAVIKANAYGHGLEQVAKILAKEVSWFVVDSIVEAMRLRAAGIKNRVLIIGYIDPSDLSICAKRGFSFVAYDELALEAIERDTRAKKGSYRIHLKIETGTTRQGLEGDALTSFAERAKEIPSVLIEGAYTHYANIEDTIEPDYAMSQLSRFKNQLERLKVIGVAPEFVHTAASAAAILYPETRFDAIRLGISLYGHWPSREVQVVSKQRKIKLDLRPSLTWKTRIAQIKHVVKGTPVSYGLTERVQRNSSIAVLPVGYWDGYDRGLSLIGQVLVRGKVCKIVGRICMNMMMVDVTDVRGVQAHDEVVLMGSQGKGVISAEEVATKIGTIQYEVLTKINPLIERMIVS